MGILIDQAPDNTWRMVVREQLFLPDGDVGKTLIDYLIGKGIVFGVTYSDKVIVHLHDVEYIDGDYEGFLKVVGEILVYKKKYGIRPKIQTEREQMQAMYAQQKAQQAQEQALYEQQQQAQQQTQDDLDEELQHNV